MAALGLVVLILLLVAGMVLAYMLGRGKDEPPRGPDRIEALRAGIIAARRRHVEIDRLVTPVYTANCLIWALTALANRRRRKARRPRRYRPYLVMRQSISRWRVCGVEGRIPHFLVMMRHYVSARDNKPGFWVEHIVSFVPIVRPAHPSLFYIALFQGRMVMGDEHAPESEPAGDPQRFPMLRAFAMVGLLFVMFVLWLAQWVWRFGRWGWQLVVWARQELIEWIAHHL